MSSQQFSVCVGFNVAFHNTQISYLNLYEKKNNNNNNNNIKTIFSL